jgi:hypothetical protein
MEFPANFLPGVSLCYHAFEEPYLQSLKDLLQSWLDIAGGTEE